MVQLTLSHPAGQKSDGFEIEFPEVTVVVLNYNGKKHIRECLDSIFGMDYPQFKVVVVDNASNDGSLDSVKRSYPKAKIVKYNDALNVKMLENDINSPLRMAHFLAQIAHESAELRYSEEIASGEAYEGRADLGNTQPGDGKRFKGRGLIQLTGRSNYKRYGKARGRDFTTDETARLLATDPDLAVDVSCWFWVKHDLNALADADDVMAITKKINGGYNGLPDRKAKLARAKFFLLR